MYIVCHVIVSNHVVFQLRNLMKFNESGSLGAKCTYLICIVFVSKIIVGARKGYVLDEHVFSYT